MKKIIFCFTFFTTMLTFSQSTLSHVNDELIRDQTNWKEFIEFVKKGPEILGVSDLKLVSYSTVENTGLELIDFVKSPIDENQYIISPFLPQTHADNLMAGKRTYYTKPEYELKPFSEYKSLERKIIASDRNQTIKKYFDIKEKVKFVRVKWEYKGKIIYTTSVVVNEALVFDHILGSIKSIIAK